jgi:DNA-binding NarL/FixJ family response regulator
MTKTRILLVDDHPLVREWLTNLINQQSDMVVCGEAENASQALSMIAATQPHLTVVDLSLKAGSGIDLIKDLKRLHPDLVVLVLSMHEESLYAERALRAGARGYIMKREVTKTIIAAIRQVLAGDLCLSSQMSAVVASKFAGGPLDTNESPVTSLSDRELEVFEFLGKGRETKQIAEDLEISMKTVQAYCARIKDKLKLANATELLREAILWAEERNRVLHPSVRTKTARGS